MSEMLNESVLLALRLIYALAGLAITMVVVPWIRDVALPWLEDKRLYNIVCTFVKAAEKLAESGQLSKVDKKSWVIKALEEKGVEMTPEVEAFIESAVKDLDLALQSGWQKILDALKGAVETLKGD